MLARLPLALRLPLVCLLLVLHTLLHCALLFAAALLKLPLPEGAVRDRLSRILVRIAEQWIACNGALIRAFTRTRFEILLPPGLQAGRNYLVIANHQSWVDIPVLQYVFNRRVPFLRFFLKRSLIWVPVLGLAWWALDFPFMRRWTREQVARRPERAGSDLEATRRACARYRRVPVSVMNFVEGTRFTADKQAAREDGYRHLLRPKAGGVGFVLEAMHDVLHAVLDVTIAYPAGRPTLFDLLADRVPAVRVEVRELPLPASGERLGRDADAAARERFQAWLNALWSDKDRTLERLLAHAPEPASPQAGSHR